MKGEVAKFGADRKGDRIAKPGPGILSREFHRWRRVGLTFLLALVGVLSPVGCKYTGTQPRVQPHSSTLSWNPSTSVVVGYNVYRGTQSGGPYTKLNSSPVSATTYTDNSVLAGQTYYYVVTAVDSRNIESAYSKEVSTTIPPSSKPATPGPAGSTLLQPELGAV